MISNELVSRQDHANALTMSSAITLHQIKDLDDRERSESAIMGEYGQLWNKQRANKNGFLITLRWEAELRRK